MSISTAEFTKPQSSLAETNLNLKGCPFNVKDIELHKVEVIEVSQLANLTFELNASQFCCKFTLKERVVMLVLDKQGIGVIFNDKAFRGKIKGPEPVDKWYTSPEQYDGKRTFGVFFGEEKPIATRNKPFLMVNTKLK